MRGTSEALSGSSVWGQGPESSCNSNHRYTGVPATLRAKTTRVLRNSLQRGSPYALRTFRRYVFHVPNDNAAFSPEPRAPRIRPSRRASARLVSRSAQKFEAFATGHHLPVKVAWTR